MGLPLLPMVAWAVGPFDRFAAHRPRSARRVDHGIFAEFLAEYRVVGNDGIARVRYAAIDDAARARLAGYLELAATLDVAALARSEQLALWLNLFNAAVVELVASHYPVASIREIDLDPRRGGPGRWTEPSLEVDGVRLSLADIEDHILFRHWRDPRLHYALHRASLGCPNLQAEPFEGARVAAQLDHAAFSYVNHPRGVAIEDGRLIVSSLYRWYRDHFGGTERNVIRHLMAYAAPARAMKLQTFDAIDGDRYDWRLNDR